jgi:heme exporter protein A
MNLVAENLTVLRGERTIIDGLSFVVPAGRALVVTGPNGAGKSTLLRALADLLKPAAGVVRLEGADDDGPHFHYLGHANGLKAALTAHENLSFWQAFLGRGGEPVASALAAVGLGGAGELPAGQLSAGQKRRLAIARLLVSRRAVWLADEPLAALDAAAEKMFAGLLARHLGEGGIAVVSTHQKIAIDLPLQLRLGGASAAAA